jgi:hypothetical protein
MRKMEGLVASHPGARPFPELLVSHDSLWVSETET